MYMSKLDKTRISVLVVGLYYYDYIEYSYKGFERLTGVECLTPLDGPLKPFKKICLSQALNSIKRMPFQEWLLEEELRKQSLDSRRYDIAILMECPEAFSRDYLKKLSDYASRTCLIMLNPITDRHKKLLPRVEDLYSLIVTCNPKDAGRDKKWIYHPDCYTFEPSYANITQDFDLSFISVDKGRGKLACEIYEKAVQNGVKCEFIIVNPTKETRERAPVGVKLLDKPLSYEQCLKRTLQAKCILEIVANNNNYSTLRTMEAVVYGRRLLTTNSTLIDDAHYDIANMQVFNAPDRIDWSFVKQGFMGPNNGTHSYSVSELLDVIYSHVLER